MTENTHDEINFDTFSNEQRFDHVIKAAVDHQEIWILSDKHGCVMLTTEDEECVPVWPNSETAQQWATGEWQDCHPEAISLKTWQLRWSEGLEADDFYVLVFPMEQSNQEGTVIHPADFDKELRKAIKLKNKGLNS